MEIPTIDPKDIAHLRTLFAERKQLEEQASAAIELAKIHKEEEITIARDGQAVVVTENDLWTEVWHLGPDSDGGKILLEKYPEPFKLAAQAEAKKAEIKSFAITKWGIDPLAMTLSDIMRITEALIDYKLSLKGA
jgi:hypothetical protein